MATNQILSPLFSWGDPVQVKKTSPVKYKAGAIGSICGIRVIDSLFVAKKFDQPIGTNLYIVEFEDGSDLEIPEVFLIRL